MTATINPETILRELTELWVGLGKQQDGDGSTGVLRACSMTLIAVAEQAEGAENTGETLAALMREHPSRSIVIRLRPEGDPVLDARVFAQCWMPFGQRRQICCEQIEITASDSTLEGVPAVVLPLAVADLPVIVWCRSARVFRLPAFRDLAGIAHKLIIDSETFPSPRDILPELAAAAAHRPLVADLAWTRLTRWRELISQIFENRTYVSRLPGIGQIRIAFQGSQPPASACYFAAWLLDSFELAGAKPALAWERDRTSGPEKIGGVEFTGSGFSVSIAVREQAAEIAIGSLVTRTAFSEATDYALLREELSIPGRDPIYERTVARAAALAVQ